MFSTVGAFFVRIFFLYVYVNLYAITSHDLVLSAITLNLHSCLVPDALVTVILKLLHYIRTLTFTWMQTASGRGLRALF